LPSAGQPDQLRHVDNLPKCWACKTELVAELDAGVLDHLGPFGRFFFYDRGKLGRRVLNRGDLIVDAAVAGHGIAFVLEDHVSNLIAEGALIRVLDDWCEPFDGYHLYYPSRRHPTSAFTSLLEALRFGE
jgi:DNA-binding transcriptional LysR family regulator